MPGVREILQSMVNPSPTQNPIYILGVGNIGKLIAFALKQARPLLPVTLLFHRQSLLSEWEAAGQAIVYSTPDESPQKIDGLNVEVLPDTQSESESEPIKNLIVTTKTYATTAALSLVRHRLSHDGHILFIQNGWGTVDEATREVFRGPEWDNLSYWAGISTAGVYSREPFRIVHAARGPLQIGLAAAPFTDRGPTMPPTHPMIWRLMDAKLLDTSVLWAKDLKRAQLRKLMVNAMINPLTVIFNCKNGDLLDSPARMALMRRLFDEAAPVLWRFTDRAPSTEPPDPKLIAIRLHHGTKRTTRTQPKQPLEEFAGELWDHVCAVGRDVRENYSSMYQDIRAGRPTEIDYINGIIVKEGRRLGIPTPLNATLVEMVREETVIGDEEIQKYFDAKG